jgi:hypothetical protein
MGDDKDKEIARAQKIMGAPWVARVRGNFHRCMVFMLIILSEKVRKRYPLRRVRLSKYVLTDAFYLLNVVDL